MSSMVCESWCRLLKSTNIHTNIGFEGYIYRWYFLLGITLNLIINFCSCMLRTYTLCTHLCLCIYLFYEVLFYTLYNKMYRNTSNKWKFIQEDWFIIWFRTVEKRRKVINFICPVILFPAYSEGIGFCCHIYIFIRIFIAPLCVLYPYV